MQASIEKLDAELDGILLNAEMGVVTGILQREMAMQNESSLDRLAEVRRQIHAVKCGVHPVARLVSPEGLPMPEFAHREEAALRLVLRSVHELHGLEKLFPDDGRTESPPPLIERLQAILAKTSLADLKAERQQKPPGRQKSREREMER